MATVVANINGVVNGVTDFIAYTIRVNYLLGEALFTLCSWALGHVSTGTRALLAFLKLAIFDFGLFIEDLTGYLSATVAFFEHATNYAGQFVFNIFHSFLSACADFVSVVIGVLTSVYVTLCSVLGAVRHVLDVAGRSFVLLIQTLPLGIAEGIRQALRTIVQGYLAVKNVYINAMVSVYQSVILQYKNARSLFKGLPGEAYLGFMLLLVILLMLHYTVRKLYEKRVAIARQVYQLVARKLPLACRTVCVSVFNRVRAVRQELDEVDSSPNSSFDTTPPYNLRQRKPNQLASSPRVASIRRQLQAEKESKLCVICSDNERNVVLLPCRHFSFCRNCVETAYKYNKYCPICRTGIDNIVHVYQ